MLKCLYEVLLYADDDDSVMHADVANVCARLINESVTRLGDLLMHGCEPNSRNESDESGVSAECSSEEWRFQITIVIKEESRAYFRALGAYVSKLRKEQGLTQAELARLLGVSQQTVFAYELGDRRISVLMLVKLAKIFAVSIEALTGMTLSIRPNRRLSPAGIRHAERFQQLSKTEQRFVTRIIDVLLERHSRQ
jgi:transcriptional regulator with XRE-family HTH domain